MIYKLILKLVRPWLKWWGKLFTSFHQPLIGSSEFSEITSIIRPFDVLLTRTGGEFSNWINPSGAYCHGALMLNNGNIIESTGKGIWQDRLDNFCYKKDKIMIVRPKFNVSSVAGIRITQFCYSAIGDNYDYQFEAGDKEFYCFELVANALEEAGVILRTHKILDGQFYTADTFLDESKFEIVYQSDKENALRVH